MHFLRKYSRSPVSSNSHMPNGELRPVPDEREASLQSKCTMLLYFLSVFREVYFVSGSPSRTEGANGEFAERNFSEARKGWCVRAGSRRVHFQPMRITGTVFGPSFVAVLGLQAGDASRLYAPRGVASISGRAETPVASETPA